MHITSKSRYALKIMIDLAQLSEEASHTQRSGLASRQGIPPDYMDHILSRLRSRGLIESIRGRGGGYRLARSAEAINMWDIFEAVEDGMMPVQCLEHGVACTTERSCSSKDAWAEIMEAVHGSLVGIRLSSIAKKPGAYVPLEGTDQPRSVQECRAPRKDGGKRS